MKSKWVLTKNLTEFKSLPNTVKLLIVTAELTYPDTLGVLGQPTAKMGVDIKKKNLVYTFPSLCIFVFCVHQH